MPHSSGGGSSSGFTHSGSHGGGSSRSGVSRHYVEGATRYCYTSPRGRKKYYFVTEEKERSLPIFEFIFIPLILFVVFMPRGILGWFERAPRARKEVVPAE